MTVVRNCFRLSERCLTSGDQWSLRQFCMKFAWNANTDQPHVKLIWSILIFYESHWISLTPNFCDGLKGFGSGPAAPAGCQVESRIWRAQLKPSATQRQHLWQQVRATASGLGHLGICLSPKSTTYCIHINNQDCNLLFCTYYEYSCLLPLVLLIKSPGCPEHFDVFDHEYHEYYIV